MYSVIIDTEYTTWPGALESGWAEPWQHREIVQIGAILVDADFREISALDLMVRPIINRYVSKLFTEITGIHQSQVDTGVRFQEALRIVRQFGADWSVIVMNADEAVFRENCHINGLEYPYGASWHRLRPFLESRGVDLTARSSGDLHLLTDTPLIGHTHNALHDVRSMACWLAWAKRQMTFTDLSQLPTGAPDKDPRSETQ